MTKYLSLLILFTIFPFTLTSMQQSSAGLTIHNVTIIQELQEKYAPPVTLKQQLDNLNFDNLTYFDNGKFSTVFEHAELPGWLFKMQHNPSVCEIQKMLQYADFMNTVIAEHQFEHIRIPYYYIYSTGDAYFIITQKQSSEKKFDELTIAEARELMHFIWLTHYVDCSDTNIFIDSKIAIIDFDSLCCQEIHDVPTSKPCYCLFDSRIHRYFFEKLASSVQEELCTEYCSKALQFVIDSEYHVFHQQILITIINSIISGIYSSLIKEYARDFKSNLSQLSTEERNEKVKQILSMITHRAS